MNEFDLIRRFFERTPSRAVLGIGDDCALLRPSAGLELALTTDMLIEGRHFARGADPHALGHKALAVNLSDLAAMGAAARWVLLAVGLPAADAAWLERFAAGFFGLAERFGVELIGGDTTRSSAVTIAVTAIGELPAGLALYRGGARPGDDIWVSGELGGAALALSHPEIAEAALRLHRPQPRLELGERLRGLAHAAIDLSDGLVGDLRHILERSQVAAAVEYEDIPRPAALRALNDATLERDCVLSGGDDYELLFTAPAQARAAIGSLSRELRLALTRIGTIGPGKPQLLVRDAKGQALPYRPAYDHFA